MTGVVAPAPRVRSQLRLIAACSLALALPLALPLVSGRVFTKDDLAAMHLPFRFLYQQALRAGDSFLWSSAVRSGFYLHGEGEAGMAHPLHYVLYRWLPLGPAFNGEIITSYVVMFAGTAMLLARLGLSREAAWFGAMLFAFGGFNLFNLMHVNHIAVLAHAPWLLLAAHVLLTTGNRRQQAWAFAGVALTLGSQLLLGNPQYVWLTFVALAYMTAALLWSGASFTKLPLLIVALAVGTLVGAAQLLPTLDFALGSVRTNWAASQRLSFSLSPLNLVQLWSPFAFRFRVAAPPDESQIVHEFIVYNGAFCTLALAWIAMRWREQTRRGLLLALVAFATLAFVLAMGRYGLVYAWLSELPGLRNFRAPSRHIVLFQFALSGIAAIAFEDLLALVRRGGQIEPRRLWPIVLCGAASVAFTVLAAALSTSTWAADRGLTFSGFFRAAPWSAFVIAMAMLLALAARGVRYVVPIVIVLAAIDQAAWGYSYAYRWGPLQTIADLRSQAAVPADARPGDLIAPMAGGITNLPVLRGVRLTDGYVGVDAQSVLDLTSPVTERLAGARWRPEGTHWARIDNTMPRVRLVSDARLTADPKADVAAIDIANVALVDRYIGPLAAVPGSARIVEDRPGSIVVETAAPGPQLLVVAERFHAGWRVSEDGVSRDALRVYGDYLGSVVSAGLHRSTFTFAPDSASEGARASLAGLAFTVIVTTLLRTTGITGPALG